MRSKQLPIIEEAPLIVVGLTMAAATTRVFLRLTGLDRPAPAH